MSKSMLLRSLFIALVVGGVVLIIWGTSSMNSFSADISRAFTGALPDKTMWLFLGGIVATVVGFFGLLRVK